MEKENQNITQEQVLKLPNFLSKQESNQSNISLSHLSVSSVLPSVSKPKHSKANSDTEIQNKDSDDDSEEEFKFDDQSKKYQKLEKNSSNNNQLKKIRIGICAMEKKANSKPMKAILANMQCDDFEIIIFSEDVIFKQDIKHWPIVDVLVSWYSEGFPLKKAQNYKRLRNPYQINDLDQQEILWDRFQVYKTLAKSKIPQSKYWLIKRQNSDIKDKYIEEEKKILGLTEQEPDYIIKKKKKKLDKTKTNQDPQEITLNPNSKVNSVNFDLNLLSLNQNDQNQGGFQKVSSVEFNNNFNNNFQSQVQSQYLNQSVYSQDQSQQNDDDKTQNGEEEEEQQEDEYDDDDEEEVYDQNTKKNSKNSTIPNRKARSLEMKKQGRNKSCDNKKNNQEGKVKEEFKVNDKNKIKTFNKIEEYEDHIVIDGQKLKRPFVEKPQDAEDHNVYIYYHSHDGGGCKKLFRKVDDKSSEYDKSITNVRKDGNYIYEEFLPTNGFDIKVYTVGPDYVHAEARKSPSLDGKVNRTATGKEVRYPVALTPEEKFISQKIVNTFGQAICGFDLLRSNGKSYVCDVNGWSFVKGNDKYYTDAGQVLTKIILNQFGRQKRLKLYHEISVQQSLMNNQVHKYRPTSTTETEELRTVVAIFRHGDRTPKQKMKMKTKHQLFIQFYIEQIKLMYKKKDKKILTTTPSAQRVTLNNLSQNNSGNEREETKEKKEKKAEKLKELKFKSPKIMELFLQVTKLVKIDLEKIIQKKSSLDVVDDENFKNEDFQKELDFDESINTKLLQMISVLQQHGNFEGINRKIQMKPLKQELVLQEDGSFQLQPTSILIILKFGGDLTHSGVEQARELGYKFRTQQYPIDKDGLIRLHNTYRHDLKTYTSDEGRCQKTAGEFLKGMLELEGDSAPIMTTLLTRNANAIRLLDQSGDVQSEQLQDQLKLEISQILNSEQNLLEHFKQRFQHETQITPHMKEIMEKIGNPKEKLEIINEHIQQLTQSIFKEFKKYFHLEEKYYIVPDDYNSKNEKIFEKQAQNELKACDQESLIVLYKRWKKLSTDFKDEKTGLYNISKIPDIYDSIKYDLIHNKNLFQLIYAKCVEFYQIAELMAAFVVPNEFGITEEERVQLANLVVSPLCQKIKNDLMWWKKQDFQEEEYWKYSDIQKSDIQSQWRHIRTRLYFTSASHLYSLYNVLHLGLESMMIEKTEYLEELSKIKSLQYLSHIVFRLYENLSAEENDNNRFRLELCLSTGCTTNDITKDVNNHKVPVRDLLPINMKLNINQIVNFFEAVDLQSKNEEEQQQFTKNQSTQKTD